MLPDMYQPQAQPVRVFNIKARLLRNGRPSPHAHFLQRLDNLSLAQQGRYQGQQDSPLTPLGHEEAAALGEVCTT
jgi:broad specificity phosphatase PhoE